jgi:alkanesulfonate monooxygenase SsuD/methylene tetrahydromethanopterin reductase-like flavin-dependent oxidoreductase (luciferase family)
MRERVEAMKLIWTEDEPSYHGQYVDFDPILSWPKPVQQPHPPVIVGGNGERVLERVIAYGDEWMPNRIGDPEALGQRINRLAELAAEAGRPRPPVSLYAAPAKPEVVESYEKVGVNRYIFWAPSVPRAQAVERLDHCAAAMAQYAGAGG